jgi:hypothetical protein
VSIRFPDPVDGNSYLAYDGRYYMVYTDSPGGTTPPVLRVVSASGPDLGDWAPVTTLPAAVGGTSVDLSYDPARDQFLVVANVTGNDATVGYNSLRLSYFDAGWNLLRQQAVTVNGLGFSFGGGAAVLTNSLKQPLDPQFYGFAAGTVDADGATVWQWGYAGGANQKWSFQTATGDAYLGQSALFNGDGSLTALGRLYARM